MYLSPSVSRVRPTHEKSSGEESDSCEKRVREEKRKTETLLELREQLESERLKLQEDNEQLAKEKRILSRRNEDLEEEIVRLAGDVRTKTSEKEHKSHLLAEVT